MKAELSPQEQKQLDADLQVLLAKYQLRSFALFSVKNGQIILIDRNTQGTVLRHIVDATVKAIKKFF